MDSPPDLEVARRRARARFVIIAIGVAVVGVAGYVGSKIATGVDRGVGVGTLALAAATGFAAFFSPCSFPLMLTFLSRQVAASRREATVSTLLVAAGAASLLALTALVMAVGGAAIAGWVEFPSSTGRVFRTAVGAVLIFLGLRQKQLIRVRMPWLDWVASTAARRLDPSRVHGRIRRDFLYGFGYLLAGFG